MPFLLSLFVEGVLMVVGAVVQSLHDAEKQRRYTEDCRRRKARRESQRRAA